MQITLKRLFRRPARICSVQGRPYIYSDLRIDRDSLPEDMYAYDVRDNCDGNFWQIKEFLKVNFFGTIVGIEKVELDADGQYSCEPSEEYAGCSSEGWFISDEVMSEREFRARYSELAEQAKG